MKYLAARWLSVKGWRDLEVGESIPSYCEVCDRQRIHYVDGFAKRGPSVLVRLRCEHELP